MWKFYGRCGDKKYDVPLSRMLNDILRPDHIQWQPTTDQNSYQAVTLLLNSTFYRILRGVHRTFATGVACWQGTLIPPDTWSCPFGTYICYTCWYQFFFSEFVVISPDYALRSFDTFSILRDKTDERPHNWKAWDDSFWHLFVTICQSSYLSIQTVLWRLLVFSTQNFACKRPSTNSKLPRWTFAIHGENDRILQIVNQMLEYEFGSLY